MAKTFHRYTIRAEFTGSVEYDESKPESYVDALEKARNVRKGIAELGGIISYDRSGPVRSNNGDTQK